MNSEPIIDARGLSCPEPVLLTEQALKKHGNTPFCVEVNSASARDNVVKLLSGKGRAVRTEETGGAWRIHTTET